MQVVDVAAAEKLHVLSMSNFGSRVAEDEADELEAYFVATDQWKRIIGGGVDVIRGPKGSGKSAFYTLIEKSSSELLARQILTVSAENPRGATVFRDLNVSPPTAEVDFMDLWKIYILCLIVRRIDQAGMKNPNVDLIKAQLAENGLIHDGGLASILRHVRSFLRDRFNRHASSATYSTEIETDGKVTPSVRFEFPDKQAANRKPLEVDELLNAADEALEIADGKIWILFDRLDVAFVDSRQLETNALRALFRTYSDLKALKHISIKIFVRDDVWQRIVKPGFAEASHVTKAVTIAWNESSLMNLAVRRILKNTEIVQLYGVVKDEILANFDRQKEFFYRVFPLKVDTGTNKSATFDWILGRTRDGTRKNAPRELIHYLEELRTWQITCLERGENIPPNGILFDRSTFKPALLPVSEARLDQTLLAEYPEYADQIKLLRGQKTLHTPGSLSRCWDLSEVNAKELAWKLVEIGFFEQRSSRENPTFWVPFVYRDALKLVQGSADLGQQAPEDEEE